MDGDSYVSCIKINGVPILPPMVLALDALIALLFPLGGEERWTNPKRGFLRFRVKTISRALARAAKFGVQLSSDRLGKSIVRRYVSIRFFQITKATREEAIKYRESAVEVEKRLSAARLAKRRSSDVCRAAKVKAESKGPRREKRADALAENFVPFEYKNGDYSEGDIRNINDATLEASERSEEAVEKLLQRERDLDARYRDEDERKLGWRAESAAGSVDADRCFDETKSSCVDRGSEMWKPQVPKTLNIVPLTLSDGNRRESSRYEEIDFDGLEEEAYTPKLVRQGSYVLETPSPMLLAHMNMQTDLGDSSCASCSEYVPTTRSNPGRRKEWNVARAKVQWEYETRDGESVPIDVAKLAPANANATITSASASASAWNSARRMRKSISLQAHPDSRFGRYPAARSADCIRTMLANEHGARSERKSRLAAWNKRNSHSNFTSLAKLGGSLEDFGERNSFAEKLSKKKPESPLDAAAKLKPVIASDKLLVVYKKVQEMHRKQMAELMFRQQREQTLLQKEFEKQQQLLLTEIRKSFPEISVSVLSENILSPAFDPATPPGENFPRETDDGSPGDAAPATNHSRQDVAKISQCPLSYVYPEANYDRGSRLRKVQSLESDPRRTVGVYDSASKAQGEEEDTEEEEEEEEEEEREKEEKVEAEESKRSSVSRELFPLASNTTHVPIIDRTIYGPKHIAAGNVINAYARGYLVRRMMRTERVIALKNTYKEALHCMLKLHVDAPLNRSEFHFLHRLQLQCDAASMNIAELFAQNPEKRMRVIAQDRELKQSRIERPTSARSYSFATQRTLARKKLKEMEEYQPTSFVRSCLSRSRCQTWTSDMKERLIASNVLHHGIKRSTSAGTVRKPWR